MDDLEERLRRGLQHPSLSGDAERILADVHRGARARRQRRVALVAAGVLAVLTATGVLASPATRPDGSPPVTSPSSPAVSPTAPTATPTPTAKETPDGGTTSLRLTITTGFEPTRHGTVWWVSAAACSGTPCALLLKDLPDGHGEKVHVFQWPVGEQSDVPPVDSVTVSDDGQNVWVWGPLLWSSHDGGKTWTPADLPGRRSDIPLQLTTAAGRVYVWQPGLANLWSTAVGSDDWADVPVPSQVASVESVTHVADKLVLTASVAEDRQLIVMDPTGAHWYEVKAPCQGEVPPISTTGTALFEPCPSPDGLYGNVGAPWIVRSTDGETWTHFAAVQPSSYVDAVVPVDDEQVLVVTGDGGLLVTADGQQPVALTLAKGETVISGKFVSPRRGYLLVGGRGGVGLAPSAPSRILSTTDGGHTWSQVD